MTKVQVRDTWSLILAGKILAWYMRLVYLTSRKTWIHPEYMREALEGGKPVIVSSWHNRNVMAIYTFQSVAGPHAKKLVPLISASKDGGLAASAMRSFGLNSIRGSSSRGGMVALKQMTKHLQEGSHVAFTPDGPRGPKYSVQGGVVAAAKLTGAVIVPMTYHAKRHKRLKSWDQLIVPLPFGRLQFAYGPPIVVPRDRPSHMLSEYSERLRESMLEINHVAGSFDG